jgi:hypothetical protein
MKKLVRRLRRFSQMKIMNPLVCSEIPTQMEGAAMRLPCAFFNLRESAKSADKGIFQ